MKSILTRTTKLLIFLLVPPEKIGTGPHHFDDNPALSRPEGVMLWKGNQHILGYWQRRGFFRSGRRCVCV